MENISNFDCELAAKYLNDETNWQEKQAFESWLNQSESNSKVFEQYKNMLSKIDTYYQAKKFDDKQAWTNVKSQISPPKVIAIQHKRHRKEVAAKLYKYAAIAVIAILLGSLGYYIGFRNHNKVVYSEIISAEKQVLNEYVLPDGSVVALNSSSKLLFPKKFTGNTREVTIIGEAFFDVKRNPEKPFVINAGNAQVKVLGTSFNVCAYPDTNVEVIVKTGKVQIINNNAENTDSKNGVFLNPGEKGTLFTVDKKLEKTVNGNPNFMAWKNRHLIFNKVPLKDVIKCLEKTYHVDIKVVNPALNEFLYEGHFDQKPVGFILDVISLTFNLELSDEDGHYTLKANS